MVFKSTLQPTQVLYYVNLPTEIKPENEVGILLCLAQILRIHGALLLLLHTYLHALVGHKGKLTVGA